MSKEGSSPGTAAQGTAVLLAAAREGSGVWFVTGGDVPLSHSATFAFSSCKTRGRGAGWTPSLWILPRSIFMLRAISLDKSACTATLSSLCSFTVSVQCLCSHPGSKLFPLSLLLAETQAAQEFGLPAPQAPPQQLVQQGLWMPQQSKAEVGWMGDPTPHSAFSSPRVLKG